MVKTENKIQAKPSKPMQPSNSESASSCKKRYKGVRMRSWGSWVTEIRAPNQKTRIWLGSYSTPEAAARAYDAALLCLKGASANLNFPISSSQQLPDTVLSPKSIQKVAAAAAADSSFLDNAANHHPTSPPPSFSTSTSTSTSTTSSSSAISSPSLSSSPSLHIEDDVSLIPSFDNHTYTPYVPDESMSMISPWCNFDSPKYTDMLNGAFFYPPMIEDVYEEGDIRLWSFC